MVAYDLGDLWWWLVMPKRIDNASLTSAWREAADYWPPLVGSHLTRRLFWTMVRQIELLPSPAG